MARVGWRAVREWSKDWRLGHKKKKPGGARRLDASIYEPEYSPLGRTCQDNNRENGRANQSAQVSTSRDRADMRSSDAGPLQGRPQERTAPQPHPGRKQRASVGGRHKSMRDTDYFGWAVALPMSRTTFQLPSCCSFQMLVYFPCSTVGLPSLSLEWNS